MTKLTASWEATVIKCLENIFILIQVGSLISCKINSGHLLCFGERQNLKHSCRNSPVVSGASAAQPTPHSLLNEASPPWLAVESRRHCQVFLCLFLCRGPQGTWISGLWLTCPFWGPTLRPKLDGLGLSGLTSLPLGPRPTFHWLPRSVFGPGSGSRNSYSLSRHVALAYLAWLWLSPAAWWKQLALKHKLCFQVSSNTCFISLVPSHVSAHWLVRANSHHFSFQGFCGFGLPRWPCFLAEGCLLQKRNNGQSQQNEHSGPSQQTHPQVHIFPSLIWSHSCLPPPFPVLSESYGPTQGEIIKSSGLENLDGNPSLFDLPIVCA